MNVSCPHCGATYRIDPRKIAPAGVKARCSSCAGIIHIAAPGREAERQSPPAAPEAARHAPPPDAGPPSAEPAAEASQESAGQARSGTAEVAAGAEVANRTDSAHRRPPAFGSNDPHARARRLARALVSDIAVYHPERRDRSLSEGKLRQEFSEEIRKSWDEYAAQVGDSVARSTPYFREALNEILARGQAVF